MTSPVIDSKLIADAGLADYRAEDFSARDVTLRDGRAAVVWVHGPSGHGILDPRFWESAQFYEQAYRQEFSAVLGKEVHPSEHLEINQSLNQRQFNTFVNLLDKESRFLEIGCSFGGLLDLVNRFGVREISAVEPNRRDAEFCRQRYPQNRIENVSFAEAELPENHYDVIVSLEVLEHVISPFDFLRKCARLLKQGGHLQLEVPNHRDVLLSVYQDSGYQKFYYHKAHIHYFTAESLRDIARTAGFRGEVSSFLMYPFFNHVWWTQNHGPQPSGREALATPAPAMGQDAPAQAVNEFYAKVERAYEQLINRHMLGDCLIYQGQRD